MALVTLVLLVWTLVWSGPSAASQHGDCKNFRLQFERVFSVPGEVAMLNSTLLSPSCLNLSAEAPDVAWYRLDSDRPLANRSGRLLVAAETLWFLNVTLEDAGEYVTVVRTPGGCCRQETKLIVDVPRSPCGRPNKAGQRLTKGVTDRLACPLKDYVHKLSSYGLNYSITWFKGCERVVDSRGRFEYWGTSLKVKGVESGDQGLYTCTLSFSLGGVNGSVSETIDAEVKGDYCLRPQVREPANDVIRADLGTRLAKRCLVFVPCEGRPLLDVDMYWYVLEWKFVESDPSERVHFTPQRTVQTLEDGVWLETWLIISELQDDDFNQTYTCITTSGRGSEFSSFTLLRTEPELFLPLGLGLGSCLLLLLLSVSIYHVFKVDLALWTRATFPGLYRRTAPDGKLYDAYVAFPPTCGGGWSDVERFALQTLPLVLEENCGFSLFIPGRDCLPGQAVVDSVEQNLQASRRVLLLYGASTFSKRRCTGDNNNTLLSRPLSDQTDQNLLQSGTKEHLSLNTSKDHLNTSKVHLNTSKEHLKTSKDHLNTCKDHLNTCKEHLKTSKEHLSTSNYHLNTSKDHLKTSKEHLNLNTSLDHLNSDTSKKHLNTSKDHLNTSKEHLNTSKEHLKLNTSLDHLNLNTSKDHLNTSKDVLNTSKDHLNLNTSKEHLQRNTNNNPEIINLKDLSSDKERVKSPEVEGGWDPPGELGCGQDLCGHARAHLECVAAMHRALLERSLKVILVELEELGSSDVELLPESVRHLRRTQGAVRWWKSRSRRRRRSGAPRWTACGARTTGDDADADVEAPLSPCVSPSCRFWKEVRYRMPVR